MVYNATRIALSERGHELATLRVLGFTRWEISYILLGEAALLMLVALPVGLFRIRTAPADTIRGATPERRWRAPGAA